MFCRLFVLLLFARAQRDRINAPSAWCGWALAGCVVELPVFAGLGKQVPLPPALKLRRDAAAEASSAAGLRRDPASTSLR